MWVSFHFKILLLQHLDITSLELYLFPRWAGIYRCSGWWQLVALWHVLLSKGYWTYSAWAEHPGVTCNIVISWASEMRPKFAGFYWKLVGPGQRKASEFPFPVTVMWQITHHWLPLYAGFSFRGTRKCEKIVWSCEIISQYQRRA